MAEKRRGRSAGPGTEEARTYVNSGNFEKLLSSETTLSAEAKIRILKAVKASLGIKE